MPEEIDAQALFDAMRKAKIAASDSRKQLEGAAESCVFNTAMAISKLLETNKVMVDLMVGFWIFRRRKLVRAKLVFVEPTYWYIQVSPHERVYMEVYDGISARVGIESRQHAGIERVSSTKDAVDKVIGLLARFPTI